MFNHKKKLIIFTLILLCFSLMLYYGLINIFTSTVFIFMLFRLFFNLWNPTQLTCNLTIGDFPPCTGIQKITGFAKGLSFHRVDYFPYWHISNSIALGYNRSENEDVVRLWFYGYVDGEHFQELICEAKVNTEIEANLYFNEHICAAITKEKRYTWPTHMRSIKTGFKTLPVGYQLYPYAEIDGTEIRSKLNVEITDLKIS